MAGSLRKLLNACRIRRLHDRRQEARVDGGLKAYFARWEVGRGIAAMGVPVFGAILFGAILSCFYLLLLARSASLVSAPSPV